MTTHPYDVPEPDSVLWRYMDFTKYVSLLSKSGLYFTRSDYFQDQFEGAKGIRKNKDEWDKHYLNIFRQAINTPPPGFKVELEESAIEAQARRLLSDLESIGNSTRKTTYINCWHENNYESEAMWRLYSSYIENAIAIRTTYNALYTSLGSKSWIEIGRVKYVDMSTGFSGLDEAFWRKRKSFEHEREVRAIFNAGGYEDRGKIINVNLSTLIQDVYVSPSAPSWFIDLVDDVNNKYDLNVKTQKSSLIEDPFF